LACESVWQNLHRHAAPFAQNLRRFAAPSGQNLRRLSDTILSEFTWTCDTSSLFHFFVMTCVHLDQFSVHTEDEASFLPFVYPTQVKHVAILFILVWD